MAPQKYTDVTLAFLKLRAGLFDLRSIAVCCWLVLGCLVPNLASAASEDDRWSKEFFVPPFALNSRIKVIQESPQGDVILTGNFNGIAGVEGTAGIARWDGKEIHSIGGGLTGGGGIWSVLFAGNQMYVAGYFNVIGGIPATNVAVWNGTNWSALGGGVIYKDYGSSLPAESLAFYDGQLIVGGCLTNAGGTAARCIARWDGTNWHELGGGVTGGISRFFPAVVHTLLADGTNLYAGGWFTNAGGITATNIAVWNGISWRSLGHATGPYREDSVSVLTKYNDDVIAGGGFTNVGGVPASLVARWDGAQWSSVGGGLFRSSIANVDALSVFNGDLYAGGSFNNSTNSWINGLARWDGTNWHAVTTLIGEWVRAVGKAQGSLYASGKMYTVGNSSDLGLLRFDGTNWATVGKGLDGNSRILSMCSSGDQLMAGGLFTFYQEGWRESLAQFDGYLWSRIGAGIRSTAQANRLAYAFSCDRDSIYAAGQFGTARLEGTNWVNVGGDTAPASFAIQSRGVELYAGHGGGVSRWDGASWSLLGCPMVGNVQTLALVGSAVYAGGSFTNLPAVNGYASYLARWDGTNWWSVGGGVNGPVLSLLSAGNDLIVGGMFTEAGGTSARRVARWSGQSWDQMREGFADGRFDDSLTHVVALTLGPRGEVFAAGDFTRSGTNQVNFIAQWDGTQWRPLGSGLTVPTQGNLLPRALHVHRNALYVGGDLTVAGGHPSVRIAAWNLGGSGIQILQEAPRVAQPGDAITYQCVVRNYGQTTISNATVRAYVPPGTEFVSIGDGGIREGTLVSWQISALPPGSEVRRIFTVNVTAASCVLVSENYSVESQGETTTGQPVFTTVRPIPTGLVALKSFPRDSAQPFRMRIQGDSGMTCVIDASTNLVNWTSLSTNAIGIDWMDFIESDTNRFSQKFYRVRTQ